MCASGVEEGNFGKLKFEIELTEVYGLIRSRLGCQVKLTKELEGMVATLPSATRNMYVDGELD